MVKRVEFAGVLASGKSTLCDVFQRHGFRIVNEDVSGNPYWDDFHRDPKKYAPLVQEWIVSQKRNAILNGVNGSDDHPVAVDFCLDIDRAYLDFYFDADDCDLVRSVNKQIDESYRQCGNPDLIIYLDCDANTLLGRIRQRGRDFEQIHTNHSIDRLLRYMNEQRNRVDAKGHVPVWNINAVTCDGADIAHRVLQFFSPK